MKRLVALAATGLVVVAGTSAAGAAPGNGLIAFSDFDGTSTGVWVVRPDATGLRRIADGAHPAWSPDGTRLAYASGGAALYVSAPDGSGARKVADGGQPAWSPDGTRLVLARLSSTGSFDADLFVVPAEGSVATPITAGPAHDFWPSWSPDGTRILFERDGDAWSVAPDGSDPRLEREDAGRPRLSPDGAWLAFEHQGAVFVAPSNGGLPRRVSPVRYWSGGPAWAPDGTRVAFRAGGAVCTALPDGTDSRRLTFSTSEVSWSSGEEPVAWQPTDAPSLPSSPHSCDDPRWDLATTLTTNGPRARLGGVVTYRAVVRNLGPDPATQTAFGVALPEESQPIAVSSSGDCTLMPGGTAANFVECNPGVIHPGESTTVTVSATLLAPGPLRATVALATYGESRDSNGANDRASATVVVSGCTVTGTYGSDVLRGTPRRDVLCGLGGDDRIIGLGGNDEIWAGPGHDFVDAGAGNDRVRGWGGNDLLEGGAGSDVVWGGYGRDSIEGGAGDDALRGGEVGGRVRESAPYWEERDRVAGGPGADLVDGGVGMDVLFGGFGPDLLLGRDGLRDTAVCGRGRDQFVADRFDRPSGCERVAR